MPLSELPRKAYPEPYKSILLHQGFRAGAKKIAGRIPVDERYGSYLDIFLYYPG